MSMLRVRHVAGTLSVLVIAACQPAAPRPQPSPAAGPISPTASTGPVTDSATPKNVRVQVFAERFTPRTDAASIRAFVPEVAPMDSGGECLVRRTSGSGATMVTAYFPRRAAPQTEATVTFDSAGHLIRYTERRGVPQPITRGLPLAQLDSAIRAQNLAIRSTTITLDYGADQGIVTNMGGGKPTNAILATVRTIERLDKLGPPIVRLERVRKLCGV